MPASPGIARLVVFGVAVVAVLVTGTAVFGILFYALGSDEVQTSLVNLVRIGLVGAVVACGARWLLKRLERTG